MSATFVAPADGVVVSTWDNAAGWRGRELLYRFDVLAASPHDGVLRPELPSKYGIMTRPAADGPFSQQAWDALLASRNAETAAQAAVAAIAATEATGEDAAGAGAGAGAGATPAAAGPATA